LGGKISDSKDFTTESKFSKMIVDRKKLVAQRTPGKGKYGL